MNRRRAIVITVGGLFAILPLRASAQTVGKIYRIGYLAVNPPVSQSFIDEMAKRGYVEGRNLVIEGRFSGGNVERLQALAAELVAQRVDVIVSAHGTSSVRAAKAATQTIPIVMGTSSDPVADGFIASLARPGGNITGNSIQGLDLWIKRMEFLSEAAGKPKRIGYLLHGSVRTLAHADSWGTILRDRARVLGAEYQPFSVDTVNDFEPAFESMRRNGIDALMIDDFFFGSPSNIAPVTEGVMRYRLPAVAAGRAFAERGVLVAYGVDYSALYRRAAVYVDQILKGANPGERPVQQAEKFELFINLKTAKALGLTIPQSLLLRADEVIQ